MWLCVNSSHAFNSSHYQVHAELRCQYLSFHYWQYSSFLPFSATTLSFPPHRTHNIINKQNCNVYTVISKNTCRKIVTRVCKCVFWENVVHFEINCCLKKINYTDQNNLYNFTQYNFLEETKNNHSLSSIVTYFIPSYCKRDN
jgi:hypothetical protein